MTHSLGGSLLLLPGAPVPDNLRSTRQAWAERMAPGRPADALPGLLAGLFSLCGQAHRTASQLAIGAVLPGLFDAAVQPAAALRLETAREHLRRIGLDWPRLLAPGDAAVAEAAVRSLREQPLMTGAADAPAWAAACRWLQDQWLHMAPATWLSAWKAGGPAWLDDWSRRHPGWLAALLRAVRAADLPLPASAALRPHAEPASLRALGAALALRPGFALHPVWHGQVAHTGPWARLHQPPPAWPASTWALLGSRLAELVRLCLPDAPGETGAGWLGWGALATGPRQGLAWVEMARGLLIHQVELADATAGAAPVVRACQVLAPTEWNFHPEGVAAQALAGLDARAAGLGPRVQLLMAALDPCVPFEIAPQTTPKEVAHA